MESAKTKKGWADRLAEAMEVMAPLFDQPHLASVRDGFVALMPLIIVGAFVLIILQFPCSLQKGSECYLGDTPFFSQAAEGQMSLSRSKLHGLGVAGAVISWTQPYCCSSARIMNLTKRLSSKSLVSSQRPPRRGT